MSPASIDTRGIRRLLIRSTNWIGDAVMTTPAVRAIRNNFPRAEISLLAKPWVVPVFQHSPHVDRIIVYDGNGRHRGTGGKLRLARELRQYRFDAAILLQNAIEAALITWLAGIPCRIGFDTDGRRLLLTHPVRRTREVKTIHQTGYYLAMLAGAGLQPGSPELFLELGAEDRQQAARNLAQWGITDGRRLIGINPSATFGPTKQWFPERFAALADRLQAKYDATIAIFGGPGDRVLGDRIAGAMRKAPIDLCGRTGLGEAMALIAACDLFITNDSGLMHVAAALQVPLIAIFGSTDPVTTGPFRPASRVVKSEIDCAPCLKPQCPLSHMNCMRDITVDMVFTAAGEIL